MRAGWPFTAWQSCDDPHRQNSPPCRSRPSGLTALPPTPRHAPSLVLHATRPRPIPRPAPPISAVPARQRHSRCSRIGRAVGCRHADRRSRRGLGRGRSPRPNRRPCRQASQAGARHKGRAEPACEQAADESVDETAATRTGQSAGTGSRHRRDHQCRPVGRGGPGADRHRRLRVQAAGSGAGRHWATRPLHAGPSRQTLSPVATRNRHGCGTARRRRHRHGLAANPQQVDVDERQAGAARGRQLPAF